MNPLTVDGLQQLNKVKIKDKEINMQIVAFTGKKKSGKTTLANTIIKQLGDKEGIFHINFADALKREVAVATGVSIEQIDLHKDQFRLILQGWGTDFRRVYGKNDGYWTAKWLKTLTYKMPGSVILCSDLRFNIEAAAIAELGGAIIHIHDKDAAPTSDTHASEQGIDDKFITKRLLNESSKGMRIIEEHAASIIKQYNL